jgi:hypothetical protein
VTVAAVVAALWFFTERDDATTSAPGIAAAPGQPLAADEAARFADDLRRGNVVILADAGSLRTAHMVAEDIAGPAEPSVREAGQAILVRRAPAVGAGVTAYAEGRKLTVARPTDPALRAFAEYWLGRAAG